MKEYLEDIREAHPAQLLESGRPLYITTTRVARSGLSRVVKVWVAGPDGRPVYAARMCEDLGITSRVREGRMNGETRLSGRGMDTHRRLAVEIGERLGIVVTYHSV